MTYEELLVEYSPKVIKGEIEYDNALKKAEKLLFKVDKTDSESKLLELFVLIIETYERETYED